MSNDPQQAFQQCLQAYVRCDYRACVEQAKPLLASGATLPLLQVVLISLQRLGQTAATDQLGAQALSATVQLPWEQTLLKLTLGQTNPNEVLEQATDDTQRCQAIYYAGARLETQGQFELARQALAAAAQFGATCLEGQLAAAELTAAPSGSSVAAPEDPARQIDRLNRQVAGLYQQGRFQEAIRLGEHARQLASQTLGEDHPNYAASLNILAGLYDAMGRYAEAEPLYRQAMDICRTALGEDHPHYATSLNNLAGLYHSMGRYAEAEPLYRQAIEIARTALGEDHPDYGGSLNNLAELYHSMGRYAETEPLYRQAMEILRTALGEDHPDYATSLDNLGGLYDSMGRYAEAEPLYRQAIEIRHTALGDHPDYATSLNNLAALYYSMGRYAEAEPLFRQAGKIWRTALGKDQPRYATSLNSLAALYKAMGRYAEAEPLYRQAMGIRRTALGEDHPDYATSLNALAELYHSMGRYAEAEPLYRQAMQIRRTALGADHPDYADSLNNLALLYATMGHYAEAEPLYRQAMGIRRTALGEDHPHFATSLNNLAGLYHSMGRYAEAEPLYRQAMEIARTALGEDHPDYAGSLNNLAGLCAASGRPREAFPLMEQAAAIDDRMIAQAFTIGSETQRAEFVKTVRGNLDGFLSLVLQSFPHSAAAVQSALGVCLRRKAIGAEALAVQRDALLGGRYPHLEPMLRQWSLLRGEIAQRTLAGPGPEGADEHRRLLAEWTAEKERLEADLARQIPEMNLEQKLAAADRRAIALQLDEGTALVEFVRFNEFDSYAVAEQVSENVWRPRQLWKPARYVAFVLPAGEPDNVQMIDLGEAEPIDRMIADFRAGITGEGRGLGEAPSESVSRLDDHGAKLRQAIFDPLRNAVGDRKRVVLSPDGDLTRLPFEVLPTERGRRLIDEYHFSYVGVGRDMLRFGKESSGEPAAAVVVGDPDFDLGSGSNPSPQPSPTPGEGMKPRRHSRDLDRSSLRFVRLPGTRAESEQIAPLLGGELWLEQAALETRLKSCRSPRILHLATHGFFLEDQQHDRNADPRGLGALGSWTGGEMGRLSGPTLENPLLRSGLALAGVNTWLQNGTVPEEAEDGLLTAEDVTGMDLLDTELVVLSACETGLGEVQIGEGVMGLRRSFVLAGAKTLVMSLWKVPDEQTQELMVDYYNRILNGESRAEALRQAQLAMKEKYPDPLYWGAFICQGDPAPLPKSPVPVAGTLVNT